MPKRKSIEQFIKQAKEKHGDKYDYSLVNYINGTTKVKIICREHGVFEQNPKCHLKYSGCIRCLSDRSNIQKMVIDKNTSYMIGLFQTDGSMSSNTRNRGKIQLELSIKDEDIVYKLEKLIPYHVGIRKRIRNRVLNGYTYNNNETIDMTICDKNFRKFFNENGVPYGKKSKIIKPPLHIPNLSISDYVRGLYDGDGSLGLTIKGLPYMSFTTDSDDIANFLVNYISEVTKKPLKSLKRNNRDNIYNIMITKEDAIALSNEIYYEGCLSLNRKYNKSLEVKNWVRPYNMIVSEKKFWTKEQDDFILEHDIEESTEYLDRTEESVKMRLWRLNKTK
jgi:DNA-binding transcriptional regulator WhiA